MDQSTDGAPVADRSGKTDPRMPGYQERRRTRGAAWTHRVKRRMVGAAAVAAAAAIVVVGGPSVPIARADTIVVIDGRGFGHGVGMAQDGAYWLGKSGRSAAEILKLFYPGTALVKQGGSVRVPLLSVGSLTVGLPNGGTVGDRKVAAGGEVTVRTAGGGLVATVSGSAAAAPAAARSMALRRPAGGSSTDDDPVRMQFASAHIAAADVGGAGIALAADPPGPVAVSVPSTIAAAIDAPVDPGAAIVLSPTTTVPVAVVVPTTVVATLPVAITPDPTPTTAAPTDTAAITLPGAPLDSGPPTLDGDDGSSDVASTTTPVAVPLLRITAAGGGVVTVGAKRYRGSLELRASSGIRVVNELDVEDYLRGMGEILSTEWPAATLQAQAIAARTYAFRTMATAGEVCPTQRCQVYLGAQAEYAQMDAAVVATKGKVLSYNGKLASTFYSASGGGTIASPSEAFGGNGSDLPYLKAGVYPTGDVKAWTVRMSIGRGRPSTRVSRHAFAHRGLRRRAVRPSDGGDPRRVGRNGAPRRAEGGCLARSAVHVLHRANRDRHRAGRDDRWSDRRGGRDGRPGRAERTPRVRRPDGRPRRPRRRWPRRDRSCRRDTRPCVRPRGKHQRHQRHPPTRIRRPRSLRQRPPNVPQTRRPQPGPRRRGSPPSGRT